MSRKLLVLAAAAASLLVGDAFAGQAGPVPVPVTASVQGNCTVSVTGTLDFGSYDPVVANAAAAKQGSGASLSLKCTRGSHPTIDMDNGANSGNANNPVAGSRAMVTGTGAVNQVLPYSLWQPTALGAGGVASATPWGAGATAYDPGVWASNPATGVVVNIFGTIPAAMDVTTGTYNDTVNATVNF